MLLSAELSLYPLDADVETAVLAFIDDLKTKGTVSVVTNSMSTQISGEWEAVFDAVQSALKVSYEGAGRQVLVAKFIPNHRMEIEPER